ncbi:MAG: hypothetical protein IKV03_04540 [Alphaproteobacteria bacterium]|nr:hypothetical protein [Alphaproteobacteria bacterium]
MFKNDYFDVIKRSDESVFIMKKDGTLYEWSKNAVQCFCPAHYDKISPFLSVKYRDNTWSLCHAEVGPMAGATRIPEKEKGVCPIDFQEDFLDEKEVKNTNLNGVRDINIQHMTGVDKNIENYERMVGNLFVGQTMTPQKVATHIGGMPIINNQNIKR